MIVYMKMTLASTAGAAAVLALTLAGCSGSNTTAKISTLTSNAVTATTSQGATPKYRILWAPTNERFDNKPTDYVVIDPVDLNNDSFKQNVKLILREIATKSHSRNGPNFSANFFDDEAVAKAEISKKKNPGGLTKNALDALYDQEEQHLVAHYTGGINFDADASTADDAYNIYWYPTTSTISPNADKYVGSEEWKP
jgi:hypothetical protein